MPNSDMTNRLRPTVFNILLLDIQPSEISSIITYVEMLHDYLDRLGLTNHRIQLHTQENNNSQLLSTLNSVTDFFFTHPLNSDSKEEVLLFASENDIDIILDENEKFGKDEIHRNREKVKIIHWYNPEFTDLLNAICAGWGVVYNFRNPILNSPWLMKYLEQNGIAKIVFDFMDTGRRKGFNEEQVTFVRSASNKITQLLHSKQLIDYTLILLRHARRNDIKAEDLLFELSYHLNNYYILMASTLDVTSRLLNSLYSLGYGKFDSYTLDKQDFLNRLNLKRKGIYKIISLKKHRDWMDWMRQRRNLFAHEQNIGLTTMIQRTEEQISEDEIMQRVEQEMDWEFMSSSGIPDEAIAGLKESMRFNIDLEENHRTVVSDIMYIEKQDRLPSGTPPVRVSRPVVFFPLRAVEDDFEIFDKLLRRIFSNLASSRRFN